MAEPSECELCNRSDVTTYFCSICTSTFCDECWPTQLPHRPGRKTMDGRPHIKENKFLIELMHSILEPPEDAQTLRTLHAEDQDTRWFGVIKSTHGGASQFHDFRRYAQLMLDSRPLTGAPRYPKLISFIGDTNAGKSTIVKALVSQGSFKLGDRSLGKYQTPVPGSTENEGVATSEGVHLYADPALLHSERPVLYADCEGLNAGERPPFATEVSAKSEGSNSRKLQSRLQPRTRDIKWTKGGDPVRGTREFAVGQLYPRFLYTFSDAIVFIQKNPKQIHKTYKYLVDWAKFNVEESINQPILPHAVVVLNAVDMGHGDQRWTVKDATDSFFRDVAGAVIADPELQKLAELRNIDPLHETSSRELLKCFYSEVHVIRVPAKRPERYSLIDEQIRELRRLIISAGDKAHHAKVLTRRLNDVDTLQEYLQAGFDHFATNIDQPFDFKSVSLRTRMIAQDFGDHIINLASTVQEHTRLRGKMLFQGLVALVASSILLDYVRNDLPGPIMDYFPSNYAPLCKAALHRFCDEHVPCEFRSKKCPECKNVKSAHVKGHQNEKGKITSGDYVSSFEAKSYESEWIESLQSRLKELAGAFDAYRTRRVDPRNRILFAMTDAKAAVRLHSEALVEFFSQSSSGQQCFSNSTCFGCLMAIPETPLPCGHAFCRSCISEHGEAYNDLATYLKCCPLHPQENFDWEVHRKPEFAGIRILTLDGGGIRGIVELEILKAIESRINVGPANGSFIPIQRFFDLIVGTSTGGIIALGLTVKRWRVDHCISEFIRLCGKAFTPHSGAKPHKLLTLLNASKWKTSSLHEALQEAFGHRPVFGGNSSDSQKYATKVAVVSASQPDCRPLVITNYNREEPSDPGYSLELPNDPRDVLKTWEAAAATSAAPSFFKPFECRGKTYLDGALNHNNPVYIAWREKKLIWPDLPPKGLDVLVSLGTGQNKSEIDAKLRKDSANKPKRNSADKALTIPTSQRKKSLKRYIGWNGLNNYLSVLINKLDNILDTERTWDDFVGDVVGEHWSTEDSARYIRVNPDLRYQPPALDEKHRLLELQSRVQSLLQYDAQLIRTVEDTANRLFASSFYFKKLETVVDPNTFICSGSIHSKFEGKPRYMEQIGLFLKSQLLKDFVPKFVVSRRLSDTDAQNYDSMQRYEMVMDMEFIDNMIAKKEFDLGKAFDIEVTKRDEPTYICLQLRVDDSRGKVVAKGYPISGFPRRFHVEKERSTSRLQKRKADIERFRSKQKTMSPNDGETNSISSFGRNRPPSFGLENTAFPIAIRSESGSTNGLTRYDSDTDYDSEDDVERQMARLKMVDLTLSDEAK